MRHHLNRCFTAVSVLLLIVFIPATLSAQTSPQTSSLFGELKPGQYGVGFTKIQLKDPTRSDLPKRDRAGKIETADRAHKIEVHIWYPAAASASAHSMTFADYMFSHLPSSADERARQKEEADFRNFLGQFGNISDSAWATLKETRLLAQRNATPASSRFPLIIGQLRPLSTTLTNEYLTSHGYVVAMVSGQSPQTRDGGPGLEAALRDMEFAIPELRKLPYVDPAALAVLGFSGSGFSQVLLAMRHPDIDAVCDLESAIFDDRLMWPLFRGWGFDVTAMRVPFLHTYSVPLSARENRISDFEKMRYSTRHHYLVDAPQIHHWDFATEGMAASSVLKLRGDNATRLRQAFETTNRYVLAFFNAYVKHDNAELAFLRKDPAANGAPAGLATIRELPAVEPAPTLDEFIALITSQGITQAIKLYETAKKVDPEADLFRETTLNQIGNQLVRNQRHKEGIEIYKLCLEAYPKSSRATYNLGYAYEAIGEKKVALEYFERCLQLVSDDPNQTDQGRQTIRTNVPERIRVLKAGQ